MTVAGDELAASIVDDGQRPEPVVLQLEKPIGVVEGRRFTGQRHRLECHAARIANLLARRGRTSCRTSCRVPKDPTDRPFDLEKYGRRNVKSRAQSTNMLFGKIAFSVQHIRNNTFGSKYIYQILLTEIMSVH
jgi:hypothetical protein